jgi:hypothetical protein
VTATILDFQTQVIVFVERLGLAIRFIKKGDNRLLGGRAEVLQQSRAAAIEKLIRSFEPGGFRISPTAPDVQFRPETSPAVQPSQPIVSDVNIELPHLKVPGAIVQHIVPSELDPFVAYALRSARLFQAPQCTPLTLRIPYYAADDPVVYVTVDLGPKCGPGVLPFVNSSDGWKSGQLSFSRAPNEWQSTIARVKANTLVEIGLF